MVFIKFSLGSHQVSIRFSLGFHMVVDRFALGFHKVCFMFCLGFHYVSLGPLRSPDGRPDPLVKDRILGLAFLVLAEFTKPRKPNTFGTILKTLKLYQLFVGDTNDVLFGRCRHEVTIGTSQISCPTIPKPKTVTSFEQDEYVAGSDYVAQWHSYLGANTSTIRSMSNNQLPPRTMCSSANIDSL